jgi:hypothetical protein
LFLCASLHNGADGLRMWGIKVPHERHETLGMAGSPSSQEIPRRPRRRSFNTRTFWIRPHTKYKLCSPRRPRRLLSADSQNEQHPPLLNPRHRSQPIPAERMLTQGDATALFLCDSTVRQCLSGRARRQGRCSTYPVGSCLGR